jgi:hypothetical protein
LKLIKLEAEKTTEPKINNKYDIHEFIDKMTE